MKTKITTSFSKLNLRRSNITKFCLAVIITTVCALKLIVISDIDEWAEETSRDVAQYILPEENTTIIYPETLKKADKVYYLFMKLKTIENDLLIDFFIKF